MNKNDRSLIVVLVTFVLIWVEKRLPIFCHNFDPTSLAAVYCSNRFELILLLLMLRVYVVFLTALLISFVLKSFYMFCCFQEVTQEKSVSITLHCKVVFGYCAPCRQCHYFLLSIIEQWILKFFYNTKWLFHCVMFVILFCP